MPDDTMRQSKAVLQNETQASEGISERLVVLGVATVGLVVFASAFGGGFIFDDRKLILDNPYVHSFEWWRRWFVTDFWDVNAELRRFAPRLSYYRPFVTASYALDWLVGRGSPVIFHLSNFVWHGVVSALSYMTLRRWVPSRSAALVAALFFVVHPTKAESVAWIAGRTDILCACALLLAALGANWRLNGRRYGSALEISATLAAYLIKETAIVLPGLLLIEYWAQQRRPALTKAFFTRALTFVAPQLLLALAYLGARSLWLPVNGTTTALQTTWFEHWGLVFETLGRSVELIFVPHHLSVQQALLRPSSHSNVQLSFPHLGVGIVSAALVALGAWFYARRKPGIVLGLIFFGVAYLPTSNVISTRMPTLLSERFLYIPLLGLALVLGCALDWARSKRFTWLALCGVALYAGTAALRSYDFSDERRFWARELQQNPHSLEAHRNAILFAVEDHHYGAALQKFSQAYQQITAAYPATAQELDLALDAVDLIGYLTPDAETDQLEAIGRFFLSALTLPAASSGTLPPRIARLVLPRLTLEQRLDLPGYAATLKRERRKLLMGFAKIQSRLGNDGSAVRYSDLALVDCPDCTSVVVDAATIQARAGDYATAQRLLEKLLRAPHLPATLAALERVRSAAALNETSHTDAGPSGLLARAQELSLLGAYGRAFQVLAPHQARIQTEPELALGFAELAWRAGNFDVSRSVLGLHLSVDQVLQRTAEWSQKMGWQDSAL